MEELFGGFGLMVVLFLLFLGVLWAILPFAVFGIKPLLERLVGWMKAIHAQNERLLAILDPDGEKEALHRSYVERRMAVQKQQEDAAERMSEAQKAAEKSQRDAEKAAAGEARRLAATKAIITCEFCKKDYEVKGVAAGTVHTCPRCKKSITMA